jgi:hypothetical protein
MFHQSHIWNLLLIFNPLRYFTSFTIRISTTFQALKIFLFFIMNFNVHDKLFLKFRKSMWKEDPNEVRCLMPMENWMKCLNEQIFEQNWLLTWYPKESISWKRYFNFFDNRILAKVKNPYKWWNSNETWIFNWFWITFWMTSWFIQV